MPALSSAPSSAALRRGGSTSSVAGTRLCAAPRTVVGRHRKLGRVVVAPRAIVSERHQVPFEKDSEHLETWSPDSWRNFEALQQPEYPDEGEVKAVFNEIARKPPLVFAGEARELQDSLGRASRGEAFVVFGGDCAESFKDFNTDGVRDTYRVLLQMSAVLMYGTQTPVVKIGRLAGQFAKPRSADFEQIGDVELPSYRGDIINDMAFTPEARVPDPWRLVQAYNQSSATLNLLRAFSQGGYASLERVTEWNLGFMESAEQGTRFQEVAEAVTKAVGFMKACGMMDSLAMKTTSFFTAHECLLLEYEEALTRLDSTTGLWYDCSAHLLWCGERTRQLDKAHVEFLRGIGNPIGVKVSDKMDPQQLVELIEKLNPKNEPGRLTIISRMSADKLRESLPTLIRAVRQAGQVVTWVCDPMHGNTIKAPDGTKTRMFDAIWAELEAFFDVHEQEGSTAGGMHLEMTGADVTECVGGGSNVQFENLSDRYHTHCDPRLNAAQALELSFKVATRLEAQRLRSQSQA